MTWTRWGRWLVLVALLGACSESRPGDTGDDDDMTDDGGAGDGDGDDDDDTDAGMRADGGPEDAGTTGDGGPGDAGLSDGGVDAGPPDCSSAPCGRRTCASVDVSIIEVCACCADPVTSACGADPGRGDPLPLSVVVSEIDGTAGCQGFEQPGRLTPGPDGLPATADDDCKRTMITVPGDTVPTIVPGCCRASGECGFWADLSGLAGGPDFGCVSYDLFTGESGPASCSP